jgi:hypothetical protein
MTTLIGKQRDIMEKAFDKLGGLEALVSWANELDDKGNKSNYREFIKLYVKLAPMVKPEIKDNTDTQESFIMSLIKAENILKLSKGEPRQIIDVDIETQ